MTRRACGSSGRKLMAIIRSARRATLSWRPAGVAVGAAFTEDTACEDVFSLDGHEVGLGQGFRGAGKQAVGLAQARTIECVAHRAGIGEMFELHTDRQILEERLPRLRA